MPIKPRHELGFIVFSKMYLMQLGQSTRVTYCKRISYQNSWPTEQLNNYTNNILKNILFFWKEEVWKMFFVSFRFKQTQYICFTLYQQLYCYPFRKFNVLVTLFHICASLKNNYNDFLCLRLAFKLWLSFLKLVNEISRQ